MLVDAPLKVGFCAGTVLDNLRFDLRAVTNNAVGSSRAAMVHGLGVM